MQFSDVTLQLDTIVPISAYLQIKYPQWLGDIRGRGLVIGLEIVSDATTKAPNSPLAVNIMYNLKAEKVLVGISGKQKNVIFISPPLCFTIENGRRYVHFKTFDRPPYCNHSGSFDKFYYRSKYVSILLEI